MALSPAGTSLADWDCSQALDALLAEDDGGESVVPVEFSLLETGDAGEIPGCGRSPPLYSPSSDAGSTQSVDSGFAAARLVSEDDQLLAGLFGEDLSDFLACEPSSSSASLSLAAPALASPPPLPSEHNGSFLGHLDSVPSSVSSVSLASSRRRRRNSMFDSDFDVESPPPATPTTSGRAGPPRKGAPVVVGAQEKSRKNAEAARQNRLKKKKYVEDLERGGSKLRAENVVLKTRCTELHTKNKKLETEVSYLRSVLANQSTLSSLIKNIPGTPGVSLTSSFSRKRCGAASGGESLAPASLPPAKRSKGGGSQRHSGGVCLHVSKDVVSLEFCSQCSLSSATQVLSENNS